MITSQEQITALSDSISHWERMLDAEWVEREEPTGESCALCQINVLGEPRTCANCPVMLTTGQPDCKGTPYAKALTAYYYHGINSPNFREEAQIELDFLKTILENITQINQE